MNPIVQMRNVDKFFGTAHILRELNLDVAKGEVLVIIGASGSGKSTLIRCVNGLEVFQKGRSLSTDVNCHARQTGSLAKRNDWQAFASVLAWCSSSSIFFPTKRCWRTSVSRRCEFVRRRKQRRKSSPVGSWTV